MQAKYNVRLVASRKVLGIVPNGCGTSWHRVRREVGAYMALSNVNQL